MSKQIKTVLVAQELGGGRGHVAKLGPVILALKRAGHRVVVGVRDVASVPDGLADAVIQAPVHHPRSTLPPSVTYPEVLLRVGYADGARLSGLASAWGHLLRAFSVDVVLAEHAPTALVAARALDVPRVIMGTGFTVPASGSPMPSFALGKPVPLERRKLAEQHVVNSINTAIGVLGGPAIERLDSLFDAPRTLCTVAELDHFDGRPAGEFAGFIWPETAGAQPQWPKGSGEPVFVYLHANHKALLDVINALDALARPTLVVSPELDDRQLPALQRTHVRVTGTAVDMSAVAAQCKTIISHGGHGLAATALCHGIAPVLLPSVLEQWVLARRLEEQNLAVMVKTRDGASALEKALDAVTTETVTSAARRFANEHPATSQKSRSERIVKRMSTQTCRGSCDHFSV